jgi:hypothetical protein
MTDWLHSITDGRTSVHTLLHCIALHCITYIVLVHCIACVRALHYIALHCIHTTERNVNSTACFLNCAIGHVYTGITAPAFDQNADGEVILIIPGLLLARGLRQCLLTKTRNKAVGACDDQGRLHPLELPSYRRHSGEGRQPWARRRARRELRYEAACSLRWCITTIRSTYPHLSLF